MSGITARVICDSISPTGKRITTFLLSFPMMVQAELLRHRAFSFSFSSNRAIPAHKQIDQARDNPAMPNFWGRNQAGMAPGAEVDKPDAAERVWKEAAIEAITSASHMIGCGVHKSIVNRIVSPFLTCHGLVTATEWDNFFALRCAPDADPLMHELAWRMWDAMQANKPVPTEWHLPFVKLDEQDRYGTTFKTLAYASAMRCARLSYNKLDGNPSLIWEDAKLAEERLAEPFHMSPFEHAARACWPDEGATDNFIGWYSARKSFFYPGTKAWNPQQAEADGWRTTFGKDYK